jgi:hypothetical protein
MVTNSASTLASLAGFWRATVTSMAVILLAESGI